MGRKKRKAIESHVLRDEIPGIGDDDRLVQSRVVPEVVAEKSRAAKLLGGRTLGQKSADSVYRDLGIPIFDTNAGKAQLDDLIQRGSNH
jgi:hypothetical protein